MLSVRSYGCNSRIGSVVKERRRRQWASGSDYSRGLSLSCPRAVGGAHVCSVTDGHHASPLHGRRSSPRAEPSTRSTDGHHVSPLHGRSSPRAEPSTRSSPLLRSCILRKDFNSPLQSILPPGHEPRVKISTHSSSPYYPPSQEEIRSDNRHKYRVPGPIFTF